MSDYAVLRKTDGVGGSEGGCLEWSGNIGPAHGTIYLDEQLKAIVDSTGIYTLIENGDLVGSDLEDALDEWLLDWIAVSECIVSDEMFIELEGALRCELLVDLWNANTLDEVAYLYFDSPVFGEYYVEREVIEDAS